MMSDLIKREDAIDAIGADIDEIDALDPSVGIKKACIRRAIWKVMGVPSADRPQDDDWEKYSDKLWKNAYERGKADGAMIYGNEHNCIMTIFGECSYAETGCGDCAIVEKVRKALSADRPQDDCSTCEHYNDVGDWCKTCGVSHYTPRMKGADDEDA